MFENVNELGQELDDLAKKVDNTNDQVLRQNVARFVRDVATNVDKAFSDVHQVLEKVAFLPPSELSPDAVIRLQADIAATYSREKFKVVLEICDRLDALAHEYKDHIEPKLSGIMGGKSYTQLFWLLEKHEGAFIYVIKSALQQVSDKLDLYKEGGNIDDARTRARQGLTELRDGLEKVTRASNRVIGALPEGTSMLMNPGQIADDVLRRSPWFSGSFYLAAALLLLTALTIVAGNVSAVAFPLVIAGAFAGLTIIGAFQLKNDNRLSEKGFLQLIDLSMRRVLLPLTKSKTT